MPDHARFAGFDGLRALAVLAVVWHHTHADVAAHVLALRGFLGVDVFFVISGFLITSLLLRERQRSGGISLRNFYARRTLRIFPLYYAVILALLLMYLTVRAGSQNAEDYLRAFPYLATYTSNWVQTHSIMDIAWSLATEEQFYLLWPPLLLLLGDRSIGVVLALVGLNQAINFGILDAALARHGMPVESLPILQCTFTPILLGVLAAQLLERLRASGPNRALPWELVTVAAVVVALLVAAVPGSMRGWPRLTFHIATTVVILSFVVQPGNRLARLLDARPLAAIGVVSYGVYLLHPLCIDVLARLGGPSLGDGDSLLFPMATALSVAAAAISYRWFELPLLSLKDRFR